MRSFAFLSAVALSLTLLVGDDDGDSESPPLVLVAPPTLTPDLAVTTASAKPSTIALGNSTTLSIALSNVGIGDRPASTLTPFTKTTADTSFTSIHTTEVSTIRLEVLYRNRL